jgi:putative drug exporter of the RND superfamily
VTARRIPYLAGLVLLLWAVAGAFLLPLAGKVGDITSTDAVQALPQDSEATRALVRERTAFPGADVPQAVVVYVRGGGITAADRAAVDADRIAFAAVPGAGTVGAATQSADGRALLLTVPVAGDSAAIEAAVGDIKGVLAAAPAGLDTAVTGTAGAYADAAEAVGDAGTTLLYAAAGVVALILLITYRSPVLWLLPLISVGLASQLAGGTVYLLARYGGVTVTEDSSGIMVVLVFGAGTDYALLLIARYREELRRHADRWTAMAVAWRRSFPAILASAGAVVAALLCLLAGQMNDVRGLGPVAAVGIAVSFAVVVTLLPALLVLLGRWVFWPFVPRCVPVGHATAVRHRGWLRLAAAIARRPRQVWLAAVLVLVALSSGVLGLRLGQSVEDMYTTEVGSVVGQRLVGEHFDDGASSPARIVALAPSAEQVAAAAAVPGVAVVRAGEVSADGRWRRIQAVLADPPDSPAAEDTLDRLRAAVHAVPGGDALVGGPTAIQVDTERAASRDNKVLMPLILVVVFAVLVLLLRALVAPLLLAASVLLSYAAALGAAGLVYQVIGHADLQPSMPLWGYLLLVPLGIDYTIFLMTRAREEVARVGNRAGVLSALTVTGGVVTSAGVVLAATFSVLLVLPLVTAVHIGLVVSIGVLIDTFIVRTLLIPALAIDIGGRIWWPGRPATGPQPRQSTVELAA